MNKQLKYLGILFIGLLVLGSLIPAVSASFFIHPGDISIRGEDFRLPDDVSDIRDFVDFKSFDFMVNDKNVSGFISYYKNESQFINGDLKNTENNTVTDLGINEELGMHMYKMDNTNFNHTLLHAVFRKNGKLYTMWFDLQEPLEDAEDGLYAFLKDFSEKNSDIKPY